MYVDGDFYSCDKMRNTLCTNWQRRVLRVHTKSSSRNFREERPAHTRWLWHASTVTLSTACFAKNVMKFLRGLFDLIFVDLALDPLKKANRRNRRPPRRIFVVPRSVAQGVTIGERYVSTRKRQLYGIQMDASALTATYERLAVSKACRKEELPHSVFIETKWRT